MESQMAHPHGEQDPNNAGVHADDQHNGMKSVLKRVKDKAKKIKERVKLHGHGHDPREGDHVPDDHDLDEEDDEDEDMVEDPEVEGASAAYASAAIRSPQSGQEEGLGDPEEEEESRDTLGPPKVVLERTTNIPKEVPQAPVNSPATISPAILEQTRVGDPVKALVHEQEVVRGQPEVNLDAPRGLEEDPHAPKDAHVPSNYETEVTDPTGSGGEEAGATPILRSFDKMNIYDESKKEEEKQNLPAGLRDSLSVFPTGSHDQFSPEPTPPVSITRTEENAESGSKNQHPDMTDTPSSRGGYTGKISTSTSAIADKAKTATNVIASKPGYGEKDSTKEQDTGHGDGRNAAKTALPVEYGKKIAATVTEKLTPVYEKVAGVGSTVMSKVQGNSSTGTETDRGAKGQDKGVSVKGYFAEKLKPGEEDRALSEVITETLNKKKVEPGVEKEKPMGKVTESEEVRRRLGSTEETPAESESKKVPGKSVVEKLKGSVGSWFAKAEEPKASPWSPVSSSKASAGAEGVSSIHGSGEEQVGERKLHEN